jgi:hypothetical protein
VVSTFASRTNHDKDAIGQFLIHEFHGSIAYKPAHLFEFDWSLGVSICAIEPSAPHTFIHGVICETVRVFVEVTKNVLNLKTLELVDQLFRLAIDVEQGIALHLVNALDLFDQQLRIADDLHLFESMLMCVFESGHQATVFRKIVGLHAEKLAQFSETIALSVLQVDAEASRAGVSARATVDVGDQDFAGRSCFRFAEKTAVRRSIASHEIKISRGERITGQGVDCGGTQG